MSKAAPILWLGVNQKLGIFNCGRSRSTCRLPPHQLFPVSLTPQDSAPTPPLLPSEQRVKAEARAAADQARMDRLRSDVLGSEERAGEVEAKTASWQKFNSTTRGRKAGGASRLRENPKKGSAGLGPATGAEAQGVNRTGVGLGTSNCASTGKGAVGGVAPEGAGTGSAEAAVTDPQQVPEEKGAKAGFACWVCRRGFKSAKGLAHHEAKSELHAINVQLRDFLSP